MAQSQAVAKSVLESIKAQDTTKLRQLFWSPLTLLLTQYRVGTIWDLMNSLFGPLETYGEPEVHEAGRVTTFKTLAKFQRGRQALTLRVWGDKAVGIGISDVFTLGFLPKWESPSYIDENAFSESEISVRPYWLWPPVKGTLNLPKKDGRKPAVLMLPGSGLLDRDSSLGAIKCFKDIAYGFASAGIVSLRMDKPVPVVVYKQAVTKTITIADEYITPGIAALKSLANHPEVDPTKIFILGGSLGGGVAPRLCKASPVPVAGIVSCAGVCKPLSEAFISQLGYLNEHFPRATPAEYEKEIAIWEEVRDVVEKGTPVSGVNDPTKKLPLPLPLSYLTDDFKHNPASIAKTLSVPMLIIQGKRDWQVTMDDFVRWQTGMEGSPALDKAEFKLYNDVGHMMTVVDETKFGQFQYDEPAHVKEELMEDVIAWIKKIAGK